MKQELNPKVVAAIVAVVVIVAAFMVFRAWSGPSVAVSGVDRVHPHPGAAAERAAEMRAAHQRGPGDRRQDTGN